MKIFLIIFVFISSALMVYIIARIAIPIILSVQHGRAIREADLRFFQRTIQSAITVRESRLFATATQNAARL